MSKPRLNYVVGDYVFSERLVLTTTVPSQLCLSSSDRCNLWFKALAGPASLCISTDAQIVTGNGLPLLVADPAIRMNARDDTALVWQKWFAIGTLPATVLVFEVFYRPQD